MGSKTALYYAAAAATAIAGMLHLMLGPNNLGFNVNQGILFIVGGIAQVFWIIPIVRRWGTAWYSVGIGGTIVLMVLWIVTRMPGNPITGRAGPADNPVAIAVEVSQAAFIGLAAAIIVHEARIRRAVEETATRAPKSGAQAAILAGIVVAIVLFGLFLLPMLIGGPMRGPPGPGGPPGQQGQEQPGTQIVASTNSTCTLTPSLIEVEGTPQQTEGPYFVDGMPSRSDITTDSSDGSAQDGIPLNLIINVYDADGATADDSRVALNGAQVDIWHANSMGVYSGVVLQGTGGKDFLRGYQITDDNGTVRFTTVYPGWYEGRAIHIHIKVRTFDGSQETFEWTSQFYLPNSLNEQAHTQPPYSDHGPVNMANEADGIYSGASTDGLVEQNAGEHLMLDVTEDGAGYIGTFNVVVDAASN